MSSTYSTSLRIELQGSGENSGTWGTITNNNFSQSLEFSIAGVVNVACGDNAVTTLTNADGPQSQANNQARNAHIRLTGAHGAVRIAQFPATQKVYLITNATTDSGSSGPYAMTVRLGASGNTLSIANGATRLVSTDGTNWYDVFASGGQYGGSFLADGTVDINGKDLVLDADGDTKIANGTDDRIEFSIAGTGVGNFTNDSSNFVITSGVQDGDIIFKGDDGGSSITALTLDMSDAGKATFNGVVDADAGVTIDNITIDGTEIDLSSGSLTVDVATDITLDAGGGNVIFASGNADITTMGTFQTTSDSQTHNVTGNFTVDASGDINLDAGGDNIRLKDGGSTRQEYTLGATTTIATTGNLTQTTTGNRTYTVQGNQSDSANGTRDISATDGINIDTTGPMTLTATGAQNLVSGGNWKATVTGTATIDASTDIILDPDGNDIILKHAGTQWGKLRDSGTNVTLYSGTTKAVSWTGANQRAEGNLHVLGNTDLDGTLNVDGATDLNGHVDLGNANTDNISIIGRVDTNIIPDADDTYNLGSSTLQWKHAFFDGTVTTDDLVADSADIGNFNIVANAISNSNAVTLTTGALTATVTGNALIDASGDITLDADGNDILFKNGAGNKTVTHTLADGGAYTITAPSTYTVDAVGDIVLDADGGDITFKDGTSTEYNFKTDGVVSRTGDLTLDISGDIVLDADGGDIDFKDAGTARFSYGLGASNTLDVNGNLTETVSGNKSDSAGGTYSITSTGNMSSTTLGTLTTTSGGNQTHNVTGNFEVDASGDITLDADDNNIVFKNGAGGKTVTYTLADTGLFTMASPSSYVVNAEGDIILDANGADVILRDNGTQFGKFTNSSNQLDIYSGATKALDIDASNIRLPNHALWLDSALGTTAQNVAGSINEIHTQLDSAVSQINVNEGRITGNDTDIAELSTRIGALTSLDSATDGNFFTTSSINNDSIVNAINELARRTVLIYDENGTLLN